MPERRGGLAFPLARRPPALLPRPEEASSPEPPRGRAGPQRRGGAPGRPPHAPARRPARHGRGRLLAVRSGGAEPRGEPVEAAQHRGHPGLHQGGRAAGPLPARRQRRQRQGGGEAGGPALPAQGARGAAADRAPGPRRALPRALLPRQRQPRAARRQRRRREAVGGGAAQEEAPAEPHHLHHLPAPRAGARLREVPLPRRLQPGGAGHEGQPARGPRPGVVSEQTGQVEAAGEAGGDLHEAAGLTHPLLQPLAAGNTHGSSQQQPAPGDVAEPASAQRHGPAEPARLRGLAAEPAQQLHATAIPELSGSDPRAAAPGCHGTTATLPVRGHLCGQVPLGRGRPAQHQHCRLADESQGAHPVHWKTLADNLNSLRSTWENPAGKGQSWDDQGTPLPCSVSPGWLGMAVLSLAPAFPQCLDLLCILPSF